MRAYQQIIKIGDEVKILNEDGEYTHIDGIVIDIDTVKNDGLPYLIEFKNGDKRWCFNNEVELNK